MLVVHSPEKGHPPPPLPIIVPRTQGQAKSIFGGSRIWRLQLGTLLDCLLLDWSSLDPRSQSLWTHVDVIFIGSRTLLAASEFGGDS